MMRSLFLVLVSNLLLKSVSDLRLGGRDTEGTLTAATPRHVGADAVDPESAGIPEVL